MRPEPKWPNRESVCHPKTGKFPKSERLCSRKEIEGLFAKGRSMLVYPLRCIYLIDKNNGTGDPAGSGIDLRVMVIVPKRNHKRAVVRNLFKRRIREAYRRNRDILLKRDGGTATGGGTIYTLAISYIAKRAHPYRDIDNAIQEIFKKLGDLSAGADN